MPQGLGNEGWNSLVRNRVNNKLVGAKTFLNKNKTSAMMTAINHDAAPPGKAFSTVALASVKVLCKVIFN